jgi:hypothetical protein
VGFGLQNNYVLRFIAKPVILDLSGRNASTKNLENIMSAFTPTLKFAITQSEIDDLTARGVTLEGIIAKAIAGFEKRNFTIQLSLTTDRVITVSTDPTVTPVILTNFDAVVVAKFNVDGKLLLQLATGDVFGFEFVII